MTTNIELDILENRTTGKVVYLKKSKESIINEINDEDNWIVHYTNWWYLGLNSEDIYLNGNKINFEKEQIWIDPDYLHRLDGPAWEDEKLASHWFVDGVELSSEKVNILNVWWKTKVLEYFVGNFII